MYNACKCNNIQLVFGYAFGTTISEYKSETMGTKREDMITYIENKDIKIANKRFSEFEENYQYGTHPNADTHKKYAQYIASYFKGQTI